MNPLVILDRLEAHAARQGDQVAVREVGPGSDASLTYAQLHARVQNAAPHLRTKLAPGEVAILLTGNRVEFFVAALAVWSAGGALMPVHTSIADAELETIIQRTRARLALTDRRCARDFTTGIEHIHLDTLGLTPVPQAPARQGPASAALLLQSSGTTGLPKIAVRPASAIDAVARNVAEASKLSPNDRVFAAIPICHAYGIENGFLAAVWAGATVHLCDGLDVPVALSQLTGQATVFPGVPFMFEVLSKVNIERNTEGTEEIRGNREETGTGIPIPIQSNSSSVSSVQPPSPLCSPLSRLRLAYSAGAPLPIQLSQGFADRFDVSIGQLYGASELGSVTFDDPAAPGANVASVGLPMSGVRIRILDQNDPTSALPAGAEGQVAISAPSMLARYVEGDAPVIDGFFMTGDLGRLDASGRLFITGRLKHLIDIGGMKVNPAEVELTLKQHPAVADCVVVAITVTETVNRLKAIVTPSGSTDLDAEDLKAFARERLAGFKVPRVIEVRQTLPRSPTGKILRRELEAAR